MTRTVDSQRQKVYDAEKVVAWSDKALAHLTHAEATAEARKAVTWLRAEGIAVPRDPYIEMVGGRGGSNASSWSGRIGFSRVSPRRWILLHEVAHLAKLSHAPGFEEAPDPRAHGAAFCAIYLKLVQHYLGVADAKALKAAFRETKARYTPKRTRVMTPEAKAELAARLAAHRKPPSPHRFALVADLPDGSTVYATAGWSSHVRFNHPDGSTVYTQQATRDPAKALTRVTEESLRKWADKDPWVNLGDDESVSPLGTIRWRVADIAADLAEVDLLHKITVARDLVARAEAQVTITRETYESAKDAAARRQAELDELLVQRDGQLDEAVAS